VRPAYRAAIRQLLDAIKHYGYPDGLQLLHHRSTAFPPCVLEYAQPFDQRGMVVVQKVTEYVGLGPISVDGADLYAGDYLYVRALLGLQRLVDPGDRVVVSDPDCRKTGLGGGRHYLGW